MQQNPIRAGVALAALSALAFGITTPLIQRLGVGLGPFTTAALLYLGAAIGALEPRPGGREEGAEPRPRRQHLPRLLLVALLGAAVAPTLFAWGLQRVPATTGALLQNGEAVFTVLLAAAIHREHVGRRVALAVTLMFAGGVVTVGGTLSSVGTGVAGSLAVVLAVLAWALDNVLTRPLSELSPTAVVRSKALLGTAMTVVLALALGEARPGPGAVVGLLLCGATGYGLSLRLYLLAQRRIGAGRTGSVFAAAPFVGALAAVVLGERPPLAALLAIALFVAGLWLHMTEEHGHEHAHAALEHEHTHRHDDGHHDHVHEPSVSGEHAHWHRHEPRVHTHRHAPDPHHDHAH